jgi:hypothetical protein
MGMETGAKVGAAPNEKSPETIEYPGFLPGGA